MGMDSQTNEQPSEEALLELGFGPDPPADLSPGDGPVDNSDDGPADESTDESIDESIAESLDESTDESFDGPSEGSVTLFD